MGQTHWHSINLLRLQHFVEIAGHGAMLLKDALPERKSAKCLQCLNFFLKHSETGLQVKKWNFEKRSHWINCGPSSQKLRIMNSLKISTWGNCAAKSGISSLTFKNFSGGFEAPPREIFRLPGWDVDGMMASQFKLSHYLFDSRTSTWRAGQWTAAIWKFVRYFETIETFLLTCAAHPKFGFASKFSELAVSTAPNASASKAWQPGTASFATLQKLECLCQWSIRNLKQLAQCWK